MPFSTDNKFKENIQYDVRGNIVGLQRNGLKSGAWTANGYTAATYGLIDNLSYAYNTQNQVTRINAAAIDLFGRVSLKNLGIICTVAQAIII